MCQKKKLKFFITICPDSGGFPRELWKNLSKKSVFGIFVYLWKFSSINYYAILVSFTKEQTPIRSLDFVHANAWMVFIALTCLKAVRGVISKGGNAKMTTLHLSRAIGGNGPMTPSTSMRTTP